MTIFVRQESDRKRVSWWLITLCVVLAASTAGFAVLAVRNAKPFTCDESEVINDKIMRCTKILMKEKGEY